jgi:hypothetical protein
MRAEDALARLVRPFDDITLRPVASFYQAGEARIEVHEPSQDEIEPRGHRVLQCGHPRLKRGHAGGTRNGQDRKHDAVEDDGRSNRQVKLDVVHYLNHSLEFARIRLKTSRNGQFTRQDCRTLVLVWSWLGVLR